MITLKGLIARPLNWIIKPKAKHWVFGADYGKSYREGTKYLFEYMIKNHPDYTCTFITQNPAVKADLDKQGLPCELNLSLRGLKVIAEAEAIFMSQYLNDIRLYYKKDGQKIYYLVHGQPYKLAMKALPQSMKSKDGIKEKIFNVVREIVGLETHVVMKDVEFVAASSEFLKTYMELDFGHELPVKVLGMPRNDALFDHEHMQNERWIEGTDGKLVITYMPTHRAYGRGEVSPSPFTNRPDIQQWMRENDVLLLVKNHPNMISKLKDVKNTDVIKDITTMQLDPQVCIYHSGVLITDYSSVWMDYLLLERPIIFYLYDNWESDDAGVHYDIKDMKIGHYCYNEEELFDLIKKIKYNHESMKPTSEIIHKFHAYVDGNSCERYYNAIIEDKK